MTVTPNSQLYEFYANADLAKYAGQWVIIINNAVVASGENVKKILEETKKKYPKETPFVAKIPSKETLIW